MNFQAAVTAIAEVHLARGRPLLWLEGLIDDVPIEVAAETGGAGDDVRLAYREGSIAEVQIKRGLQTGPRLWNPLLNLAQAIHRREIDYGVLVVCPNASRVIRNELARDVRRLGEGRGDRLGPRALAFKQKLDDLRLPINVCARLRLVTMHVLDHDSASVVAAWAELDHLCQDELQIGAAWDRLYRDAATLIDFGGARRASSVLQLLKSARVRIAADPSDAPVAALARLSGWVLETWTGFGIVGVRKHLSIDGAWIPLQAVVRDAAPARDEGLAEALERYHGWGRGEVPRDAALFEADTLGRFYRHAVVVAGPGMGKSTLLLRLARRYAEDGFPVLHVSLPALAVRMRERGCGFAEALFELGLGNSNLQAAQMRAGGIDDWVLLCDGLDECGQEQEAVADGLRGFVAGHPRCRTVVTTRPIGYRTAKLADWRHYDLVPLDGEPSVRLAGLIRDIVGEGDPRHADAATLAKAYLERSRTGELVARSPMMLGIAASLFVRGIELGRTRAQLYAGIFKLLDDEPPPRVDPSSVARAEARKFLAILGWNMIEFPLRSVEETSGACAAALAEELGCRPLPAQATTERCLRYWQDMGIVERVHPGGTETLTFVHKTFGEYAAARYLADLPECERQQAIAERVGQGAWAEVLGFAVTMGLGDAICGAMLDAGEAGHRVTLRCLELAGESEPPLSDVSDGTVRRLLERAFAGLCSEHRQRVYETGTVLLRAAGRFPAEAAGPRAAALLDDARPWTRLAAWASALEAGPDYYDLERLQTALKDLPPTVDLGAHPFARHGLSLRDNVRLGGEGRELVETFALNAVRQILERCPDEVADALLPEALKVEALKGWGFCSKFDNLLLRKGKFYRVGKLPEDNAYGLGHTFDDLKNEKTFRECEAKALKALAFEGRATEKTYCSNKLLCLGAFLSLSQYGMTLVQNIVAWKKAYDEAPVEETLRAFARLCGLPADQLAHETRIFLRKLESTPVEQFFNTFALAPPVDAPAPDWAQVKEMSLDFAKLEAACHHGSTWLVSLAAHFLAGGLESEALRPAVARLFARGQGFTLRAATHVAARLPSAEAAELIYERLRAPLVPGCAYLYELLTGLDVPCDGEAVAALRAGLLGDDAEIAVEAAAFALTKAKPGREDLHGLLREAYAHWQRHEEPCPTEGIVPYSPRAKILAGMARIRPHAHPDLLAYAEDRRSDVREAGTKALLAQLTEHGETRRWFVDAVVAGAVPPRLLDRALKARVPFDAFEVEMLRPLLHNPDLEVRFAAFGLLDPAYLPADAIEAQARAMTRDAEQPIRDAAYHLLDWQPHPKGTFASNR